MESHTTYLEHFYDDLPLLFTKDDSSIVVSRAHSDPQFHSLHDQSFQVGMIVDSHLQHLQEVSFTFDKTLGFLKQVLQYSLFDLHFSSVVLEKATISIDTSTLE